MADFRYNELRRLDLTVLLVFMGLLRHRKATRVADELALTQSGVSHALKRLREVFGDELFLRRPHGMEPTAAALALEAPVAEAIEALRRAIGGPRRFDPGSAEGTIRIAALDAELVTLIPGLIGVLRASAPQLRLVAKAIGRQAALDAITGGELDIALGYFWKLGDAFIKEDLFQEDFLVVGNRSKYRLPRKMMLDTYLKCSHILVSPGGDLRGVVDDLLESKGLQRRVIAALPLFLPTLAAVQATNALATVPRRIALNYAKAFHLVTAEPPLAVRSFSVAAVWHRRDEHNPMHRWLVHRLLAISGTVPLDAVESPQSVVFRVIDCITFHSGQSHGNLRLAPSEMKRALIVLVPLGNRSHRRDAPRGVAMPSTFFSPDAVFGRS